MSSYVWSPSRKLGKRWQNYDIGKSSIGQMPKSYFCHLLVRVCSFRFPFTDLLWRGGTRFAVHVIYIVQQIACHMWECTCPTTLLIACSSHKLPMSERLQFVYGHVRSELSLHLGLAIIPKWNYSQHYLALGLDFGPASLSRTFLQQPPTGR